MAVAAMRSTYRLPNASRGEYAHEYRLLCAWAVKAQGSDANDILHMCGLTGAASIPTWSMGLPDRAPGDEAPPIQETDLPPLPDPQVQAVGAFMEHLQAILPEAHTALLARHRRLVHGEYQRLRSEAGMAQAIYGTTRGPAHSKLAAQCVLGYAALHRWMESLCLAKTG